MLAIDLGIFSREAHVVKPRKRCCGRGFGSRSRSANSERLVPKLRRRQELQYGRRPPAMPELLIVVRAHAAVGVQPERDREQGECS